MRHAAVTIPVLVLPAASWAQTTAAFGSGASLGLSQQLLCNALSVSSGNIALFIGLCIALYGLWYMVRHGSLKTGFILVIAGALLTAMPSLILSGLKGTAAVLRDSGITNYGTLDGVDDVVGYVGNCSSIPIDYSSYQNMTPTQKLLNDPEGTGGQTPSFVRNARSPSGAVMDPNATTGSGGCAHLVQNGRAGSPFGPRRSVQTTNGRASSSNHPGVDITCGGRDGPAIYAAGAGTITFAGSRGGYGRSVHITHGSGQKTTYNHLSAYAPQTQNGASVGGNQVLGACGSTGNVTGAHLHFEVIKDGKFVDPVANGCGG